MIRVSLENVTREFEITREPPRSHNILERLKIKEPKKEKIKALNDINLEVRDGEWLGIIGENGSGKTTLLKVIGEILEPTEGKVETEGKLASILSLGTAFKDELSARENVYLYGSLMGLSKKEVDKRYEDIVSFSELYDYMNTKFRKFSDGMKMRLAFATAINVEADILLSDEVLAVGDGEFREKCYEKMKEFKENNKTIIFVSHSLGEVKKWCDRVVFLDNGSIKHKGDVKEAIEKYRDLLEWKGKNEQLKNFKKDIDDNDSIDEFRIFNSDGKESYVYSQGEGLSAKVTSSREIDEVILSFRDMKMGDEVLRIHSRNIEKNDGKYLVSIDTDSLWLDEGRYEISLRTDKDELIRDIEIEVIEGDKEPPSTLAVPSPESDERFPIGKFYVLGDTDGILDRFEDGESVSIYYDVDLEEAKKRFGSGIIINEE